MTPPPHHSRTDSKGAAPANAVDAVLEAERDVLRVLFPLPPPRPAQGFSRRRATSIRNGAVVAMVLAAAAAALLWADPAWRTEHHATAAGERRDVPLDDGSTLTLDTATTLEVSWHLRSRRVTLQQGRARFMVEPSALRPFEVTAADARIRVVGTTFDVYRQQARVSVTVLQGRVQVYDDALQDVQVPPWFLGPGEQWRLDGSGNAAAPEQVDLAQAGAWRQGRLVFDRTPLREALAEVQRYRSTPIRLRDDGRLGSLAVSGVFDAANTDQILDMLPRIVPARVQRRTDGSVDIAPF